MEIGAKKSLNVEAVVKPSMLNSQIEQLKKFYDVETLEQLVRAQDKHIEKLQEELALIKIPFFKLNLVKVREG